MKRRAFLATGATTVVFGGFGIVPVIPKRPTPTSRDALGWIRHHDGRYLLFLPCAEMGQHIGHALRRVAALELGVAAEQLDLRLPASTDIGTIRATVGSESVQAFALPLARACATLRGALAAGTQGQTLVADERPIEQLRSLSAAALAGADTAETAFLRAIVTGAPLYAADMRLAGMVYGRVLRATVSPELASAPEAWNEAAARALPGFVALVRDDGLRHAGSLGLGIVARTPGALDRIEQALAVRWRVEGEFGAESIERALDIDAHLARGALRHSLRRDALDVAAPWTVDLRLDVPFAAHAGIEPRAALAAFSAAAPAGPTLHVYTGTQDLFYVRDTLARRLALPADRVRVQACRIGGGFGARTLVLAEVEAAVLARAAGVPVKVMWSRSQEFAFGFHRPPSSHRIRARLEGGRIVEWWHAFTSSHILFTPAAMPRWMQRAADFIGDQGVARGAQLPYAVPRQRIEFDALRLPVHGGPWRGLGAGPNGLAVESAIDACARAARADALAFRLAQTRDARLARVLRAVAEDARWGSAPVRDSSRRRGRGLACGVYKDATRVAVVADVEVDRDGTVRVESVWCAHDCGRVIVADGVRAQVEGCLVWCLGMVLVERLPVGESGVSASGFAQAPIPRFDQVPPIHVRLIDSDAAPSGAGESAMTAGAAAIANAVFDATGVRGSRFPLDARVPRAAH